MTIELDVIKLDIRGKETWRYRGSILREDAHSILIEAFFNRDDLPFHGITLVRGDRFIEQYYSNRWYNIDEIHDPVSGELKAWYCNVARPAVITPDSISYIDLALDLLVYPDGRQRVLDEDEFEALDLSIDDHKNALKALAELKTLFRTPKVFDLT
mgnify:CR=1 FL=1